MFQTVIRCLKVKLVTFDTDHTFLLRNFDIKQLDMLEKFVKKKIYIYIYLCDYK